MVKEVVLSALGFAIGVSVVSAFFHARGVTHEHWRVFYIMSRLGFAIAFTLLLEAIVRAPFLEGSWRVWLFVLACLMTAIGFVGVAIHDHKGRKV